MQQESDFKPDQVPVSHIGSHQPPQRHTPRRKGMHSVILVAIGVLLLGGGFAAGMQYQKGNTPITTAQVAGMNGQFGRFGSGMRQRAGGLGTVTAVNSTSITITERSFGPNASSDGSSKTYTITDSTQVTQDGASAAISDIKTGDMVLIRTASSTSTTASSILINPSMGPGPGAPSATQQNDTGSDSATSTSSI